MLKNIAQLLSEILLVTVVATIVLAFISYAAFRLRRSRKPESQAAKPKSAAHGIPPHGPIFFEKYEPSSAFLEGTPSSISLQAVPHPDYSSSTILPALTNVPDEGQ